MQLLDPTDRTDSVPKLAAWYQRCYDASPAIQEVWGGKLQLCAEAQVGAGKQPKESKEEKKAREKARKKERDAARKAEAAAAPLGAAAATAPSVTGAAALRVPAVCALALCAEICRSAPTMVCTS